jgi:hypothetical protein
LNHQTQEWQRQNRLNKSLYSHFNNFSADRWRFPEVDYSSANNNFGGFHNASNLPSSYAFAALKPDGSIKAWGDSDHGGSGEPTDNDYTKIYSTSSE